MSAKEALVKAFNGGGIFDLESIAKYINLEGSALFLRPNKPISNLCPLGWNVRISAVWNYGIV